MPEFHGRKWRRALRQLFAPSPLRPTTLRSVQSTKQPQPAPTNFSLPFRPWWYHPSGRHIGKHRGEYKYWPEQDLTVPILLGVRSMLIRPYVDRYGKAMTGQHTEDDMITISFTDV